MLSDGGFAAQQMMRVCPSTTFTTCVACRGAGCCCTSWIMAEETREQPCACPHVAPGFVSVDAVGCTSRYLQGYLAVLTDLISRCLCKCVVSRGAVIALSCSRGSVGLTSLQSGGLRSNMSAGMNGCRVTRSKLPHDA